MYVCVCVCERERERERDTHLQSEQIVHGADDYVDGGCVSRLRPEKVLEV